MNWKQLHPERVLLVLLGTLVPTVWALGLAGYFTGNDVFYRWAVVVLGVTLVIASTPLIVFVIFELIEKFRGGRHD
jgi:hypothetical protein